MLAAPVSSLNGFSLVSLTGKPTCRYDRLLTTMRHVSLLSASLLGLVPLAAGQTDIEPDGAVRNLPPTPATQWEDAASSSALPTGTTEPSAPAAPMGVDRAQVQYLTEAGELWMRGANYKASATAEGFTFYPFLGSDAPRTWPVSFRLRSAELAGVELELSDSATVSRNGHRVILDRGVVDVTYDMDLDSIEQSFLVDAAGAQGDLVLELDVTTDLSARAAGAGFSFDGPRGGMNYGSAIVLDGAGRRADVASTLDGDTLRLTVPASFLAAAEGLVVVDPVLSSWAVDTFTESLLEPDVAYEATTNIFTYVYEERFSNDDHDIYLRSVDMNGNFVASGYASLNSDFCEDAEIACQNASNTALVVFSRDNGNTGDIEIRGIVRDLLAGTFGTEFLIGEVAGDWINRNPDVGGNGSTATSGLYMVVWSREFSGDGSTRPRYRTVAPDGTLGPITVVDGGGGRIADEVVISKGVGLTSVANYWTVAFRNEIISSGEVQIRARQFNADGTPRNNAATVYTLAAGENAVDIDVSDTIEVDGASPTYLIAYDEIGPGAEDTWLLVCRNTSLAVRGELALVEHAVRRNQVKPRLSTTADDFVVSYFEQRPGTLIYDAYVTTFQLIGGLLPAISERRALVGNSGGLWSGGIAMASRMSGGLSSSSWVGLGWSRFSTTSSPASFDIDGARFGVTSTQPAAFQYCYGQPNSTGEHGFIRVEGNLNTTSSKRLVASGLPVSTFGYFIVGTTPTIVANPGGSAGTLCVGGVLGRYANAVANTGLTGELTLIIDPTMIPTPTGFVSATAGSARAFQAWHRDSDGGGNSTSNFTNAATIVFQ